MIATQSKFNWGPTAPGGLTTQMQFNDAGAFGGTTGLTWNKAGNGSLSFSDGVYQYFGGTENDTYSIAKRIGQTRLDIAHTGTGDAIWYFDEVTAVITKSISSSTVYGFQLALSVVNTGATQRNGFVLEMSGGASTGTVRGLAFDVTSSSTETTYISDTSVYGYRPGGVSGLGGFVRGVHSGIHTGGMMIAGGSSSENYAVWASATVTRTFGVNIAVFGGAANGAGLEFAGAFVLGSRASKPVTRTTSAALLCDNSTLDEDIFVGMHNGTDMLVQNSIGRTGQRAGVGTAFARIGGVLNVNTTSVGNVGTGEDDLMTYTVPADTLDTDKDFIEFEGSFILTTATGNLRAYFGSTKIVDHSFSANSSAVVARGIIYRTGATTQLAYVHLLDDTGVNIDVEITTPAETLSGTVVLKFTAENTIDDEMVQKSMNIKWQPGS